MAGFIFHLEQMLSAGIPLLEALNEYCLASGVKHQVAIVSRLVDEIDTGRSLSQACAGRPEVFNSLIVSMLQVGEQSGRLEQVLRELGDLLKWQDESATRLKRMMIYPAFVAVVLLVVIFFVMTWLVPGLVSFISAAGAELPWHTRALITTSEVVTRYWIFAVVMIALGVFAYPVLITARPGLKVLLDGWILRAPLIGPLLLKTRLARFSRCASMMYSAGINIVDALRYSQGTLENRLLEQEISKVGRRMIDGQGVAVSFAGAKGLPALVPRVLKVGESTGALDVSFNQLSSIYDRESRELTEKLEQSLGPIMTIIVGVIMMWVVVSVIGPIYDLVFGMSGGQF